MYRGTSNQSISGITWTKVGFNAASTRTPLDIVDTADNAFDIPPADEGGEGVYFLGAHIEAYNTSARPEDYVVVRIRLNNSTTLWSSPYYYFQGPRASVSVSTILACSPGQAYSFWIYSSQACSIQSGTESTARTSAHIHQTRGPL